MPKFDLISADAVQPFRLPGGTPSGKLNVAVGVRPFVPSAPSCWYGAGKDHIQPWSPTMPLLRTGKGDFAPFCRGWDSGFKASEFLPGLWVQGLCYDQVLSLTILILGFGVQGFRNQNRVAGFKARP